MFEFIYFFSIGIMLFIWDWVLLRYINKIELERQAHYLKANQSIMFFVAGMLVLLVIMFVIPWLFEFKRSIAGWNAGMFIYLVWAYKYSMPEWKAVKRRVNDFRMKQEGQKGRRIAGLIIRRPDNYIPQWLLYFPWFITIVNAVYSSNWLIRNSEHNVMQNSFVLLIFLLVSIFVSIFISKGLSRMVNEPIDLSSKRPDEFAIRTQSTLKVRLWMLYMYQLSQTLVFLLVSIGFTQRGRVGHWAFLGVYPLLAFGMICIVISTVAFTRLEKIRWDDEI